VEVLGQSKLTAYRPGELSPIFNEVLFFEYTGLTKEDLETGMFKIAVLDHDFIGANNMIG